MADDQPIFRFEVHYAGQAHGTVACRAPDLRAAFARVREERPAYRDCRLVYAPTLSDLEAAR
ncbi:hypothetical protein [Salinisphaera orenii]|uniref:hypothetical protein n=1 Tax=Salinisphaera orenii TaxID=856731 RepID=UPI0013A64188